MLLNEFEIAETIYKSQSTVIYRALHDHKTVVLKWIAIDAGKDSLDSIENEFRIYQRLKNIKGVSKFIDFRRTEQGYFLVIEDIQAVSLKKFIQNQKLNLDLFLKIASSLSQTLAEIHNRNIIHKDINPNNIIVNSEKNEFNIIDFGISTMHSVTEVGMEEPEFLEGTLSYISPEQTGRMNRRIDYRTDFYSLGITFYEMLTGRLPFQSEDPLELIHSHIAVQPEFPDSEIPEVIRNIVNKLISKNAENRYQNALSLKRDLEECLSQNAKGNIENFEIDTEKSTGKLLISEKLYGRESELQVLLGSFEQLGSRESLSILMVSGYSGIGKSSLVNKINKYIIDNNGIFVSGKFNQLQKNIPYSALIQALKN